MTAFEDYSQKYQHVRMRREDGILEMTLHSEGGSLQWNLVAQGELAQAFTEVGADRANRIIIITGTGDDFIGPRINPKISVYKEGGAAITPLGLDRVHWNAKRLMTRLLDIEVPMIGVINGPAKRHAELGLMCDIVIASETATFEDTAHFSLGGQVPGDGINIVYSMLMGLNRARYLMLTGQILSAKEAKEIGLVSELWPKEKLQARAWELARQLARKNDLLLRYTRVVLTEPLRELIDARVQYHLGLETLAKLEDPS